MILIYNLITYKVKIVKGNTIMEFKTQKSVRLYLHPYLSRRIVMFMHDFKLVNIELKMTTHYAQKGASLALLGSDGEQLPWLNSTFDRVHDGYPVYTLHTTDVCGADVSMEAFCDENELPATYLKITVENNTNNRIAGSVYLLPCTAFNDKYLTGMWDTGYSLYSPNIRAQYMLDSNYEYENGVISDGYAAVRIGESNGFDISFNGRQPHFFKPSNYMKADYFIEPGESRSFDAVFALSENLPEQINFDEAKKSDICCWKRIFDCINVIPSVTGKLLEIFYSQITVCLQMIQRYSDGVVYPRQGCIGRYIWAWEAAHYLIALDRIGLSDYTTESNRTLLEQWMIIDPKSPECGKIANPKVNWANTNGSVIWCVSEHLLATKSKKMYDEFIPYLKLAVKWIEMLRSKTGEDDVPFLFPPAVASDWAEIGQHYTYTDSVNIMGYRSLVKVCEMFDDPQTEDIRSLYDNYYGVLQDVIESLVKDHDEGEDYMPTHILGKKFEEVRTHCYTTDGVIYLPMCGNLDPKSRFFGFVERFYERHGLCDNNMRGRISNLDFGMTDVYGDCYYTNVAEICWFYAYLQKGDREKAGEMLDSIFRFNLTDEYATAERYTPISPWYAPWQPNASASGRIIIAMLDYYGAKEKDGISLDETVHR